MMSAQQQQERQQEQQQERQQQERQQQQQEREQQQERQQQQQQQARQQERQQQQQQERQQERQQQERQQERQQQQQQERQQERQQQQQQQQERQQERQQPYQQQQERQQQQQQERQQQYQQQQQQQQQYQQQLERQLQGQQQQRKANNVSCTSATAAKLSRAEYMTWWNTLLASSYAEAKELGTGEAYCQFVHAIFPEAIQLKKVKWNSQLQSDWSDNLKLMATALKNLGVVKIIAVEKLVECKTMENFEFLQWCYLFYAANKKYAPEAYDALAARGGIIIPQKRSEREYLGAQGRAAAVISPRARAAEALRSPTWQQQQQQQQQQQYQQQQQQQTAAALEAQLRQYVEASDMLQREKEELAEDLREADKDRNDYYAKLCAIETYCKAAAAAGEEDQCAKTVLNLLYKADASAAQLAAQQLAQQQQQMAQCCAGADAEMNGNEAERLEARM